MVSRHESRLCVWTGAWTMASRHLSKLCLDRYLIIGVQRPVQAVSVHRCLDRCMDRYLINGVQTPVQTMTFKRRLDNV